MCSIVVIVVAVVTSIKQIDIAGIESGGKTIDVLYVHRRKNKSKLSRFSCTFLFVSVSVQKTYCCVSTTYLSSVKSFTFEFLLVHSLAFVVDSTQAF